MALKGAMHVTGRGFAVAFLLTCAAISLMALRKTSNSTAAMQLEAGECTPYDSAPHRAHHWWDHGGGRIKA